jgi:hypothetical protein
MRDIVFAIMLFCSFCSSGQSITGFGIFGALTQSAHYYTNTDTYRKADTPLVFNRFYPPSHISKEYFSWGAGVFLEVATRGRLRWQTELEYTNTGAREKELINPFTGDRSGSFAVNKYTYFQWNNYLKSYNAIGVDSHWYILAGVRIEYLYKSSTPVFSSVSSKFPPIWFSGDVALGYEFPVFKSIFGFVEYHFNPDIIRHTHDNVKVRSRTFELRVGLVKRKKKRNVDDCNAPKYNGPTY